MSFSLDLSGFLDMKIYEQKTGMQTYFQQPKNIHLSTTLNKKDHYYTVHEQHEKQEL